MRDFKKNFSQDEWKEITSYFEAKTFLTAENILNLGEIHHALYYLKSGIADIFIKNVEGKEFFLGDISEGSIFGEIGFIDSNPRSAIIRAQIDVELDMLDRDNFMKLKENNIELAFKILWAISTSIAHRLRITNSMMRTNYLESEKKIPDFTNEILEIAKVE